MTNTIVTGASGFIGSHLVKRLKNVMMLDHEDIKCGNSYDADKCFFLSTYGNMAHHTVSRMVIQANVGDLLTITNGFTGWFCYMSSSSVMLPVQTPYSRSKRAGEEILKSMPELKSCIVRPYSVTGVGEQREHLIPTLIRSCMEGEEMPFDPEPVHDFVDVEDVVNVLCKLSELRATGMFEIGNGYGYTNQEVKELVEYYCDKKANVKESKGLRPYDNKDWRAQAPSLHPFKSLATSIQEMVEAYKRENGI